MLHISRIVWIFFITVVVLISNSDQGNCRRPLVLFDQGHGQRFLAEDGGIFGLSDLVLLFQNQGFEVRSTKKAISNNTISTADILIISGPFKPFTQSEIDNVYNFINRGGRVCIMLHISSPLVNLLQRLGVATSNGVIREQENILEKNPMDFRVTNLNTHSLTSGIETFNIFGSWALINDTKEASVIATTSPRAWIDLNRDSKLGKGDAMQALGVIVAGKLGMGSYVVFGDDAIFQNQFLSGGNKNLARNLVVWLGGVKL